MQREYCDCCWMSKEQSLFRFVFESIFVVDHVDEGMCELGHKALSIPLEDLIANTVVRGGEVMG